MTQTTGSSGEGRTVHSLADVDVLRERLDASYSEAKEALDATGGDLVGALAYIEQTRGHGAPNLTRFIQEVVEEASTVVSNGEVKSAQVLLNDQPIYATSLALAGAAGAALVVLGAILSQCRVEVAVGEREDR